MKAHLMDSFDLIESGISQLNELLAASAVVDGFEAEVSREGELPLQGDSELGKLVARFGWEVASLARVDFDRRTSFSVPSRGCRRNS
jgi:hypothetical protein